MTYEGGGSIPAPTGGIRPLESLNRATRWLAVAFGISVPANLSEIITLEQSQAALQERVSGMSPCLRTDVVMRSGGDNCIPDRSARALSYTNNNRS